MVEQGDRHQVDFETASNAVKLSRDSRELEDEVVVAVRVAEVMRREPWNSHPIQEAIRNARRKGQLEGLAYGYKGEGLIREMVDSYLSMNTSDKPTDLEDNFKRLADLAQAQFERRHRGELGLDSEN